FSGAVLVAEETDLVVAADASLYYRQDLLRTLPREHLPPGGRTASHLILAAYRAWGAACTDRLEGDWAFILWDRQRRRVFCARDFGGKRPLFYAELEGTLVVASTISALLAHPRCPHDLNLTAIAADAAGLFAAAHETAYRAISLLPAGWSLEWEDGATRLLRHWHPPPIRPDRTLGFEAAAEELRSLLRRAVAERLPPAGPASVWLSGGWDSTAVFGTGERVLHGQAAGQHLRAVSLSYPPGDPGREDELIAAVVAHWGSPVKWLDIAGIPLLDRPQERAASRDEPFAHAFEMGNRALAEGSRQVGARVAFDGSGGDQLFQVTHVYLADLFRTLRWRSLAREWRLKGLSGTGPRNFFRWAVQPVLPPPLLSAATALRGGRPLRGYLERPLPEWMDARFVRAHGLLEREKRHTPPRSDRSRADYETLWYLSHPYFPRAFAAVAGFALEAGVELRSPLYDRRIVEFALSRPREERAAGNEIKRLLRRAVRGLLPDHILAPRPFKTGTSGRYLERSLRKHHAALIERTFQEPLALAEVGIVDSTALRRLWSVYLRQGGGELGVNLFLTFQTEIWLRARR
ncbi:MAG TPA: asparagine synthase-related protein, partial [Longimicrobiaceae bacterium]|nr:asparagine synthase-related protein [Longimicrobiaceae bacterium]